MVDAAGEPIELDACNHVHLAGSDGCQHGIEGRAFLLGPRDTAVHELGHGPAAGRGEVPEREELVVGGLVGGADPAVERRFGWASGMLCLVITALLSSGGYRDVHRGRVRVRAGHYSLFFRSASNLCIKRTWSGSSVAM